jgi:hypothetical protein
MGMLPDVTGNLLTRVTTTAKTAINLRNRVVKLVLAAAPPAAAAAKATAPKARAAQDVVTFDVVMPGLAVLIGDEMQQIQTMQLDPSLPAAAGTVMTQMLAADQQILDTVNTTWPPAEA